MSVTKPNREWLPLDRLVRDPALLMRTSLPDGLTDPVTVERYREAILENSEFPPLEVVSNEETYWLFDGFQRAAAMELAGKGSAECLVFPGTRQDALLRAISANAKHGLTRSLNDCRRALTTLLDTPELLQKVLAHAKDQGGVHLALASTCGISKGLVYKVLEERNLRVIGGKLAKKRSSQSEQTVNESASPTTDSANPKPQGKSSQADSAQPEPGQTIEKNTDPVSESTDIRELERARTALSSIWNACLKMLEGRLKPHLLRCAANHRIPIMLSDSSRSPGTPSSDAPPLTIEVWEPLRKIEAVLSDLAASVCSGLDDLED